MQAEILNKSYKKINLAFIAAYFSIVVMIAVGYFFGNKNGLLEEQSGSAITLTSFYYLFLLCSIPLSLYLFNKKTKQWATLSDESKKLKKYENGAIWRVVGVWASGFIGTFIQFFLISSTSLVFCISISVVSLLFCKTNTRTIYAELNFQEEEKESNNS